MFSHPFTPRLAAEWQARQQHKAALAAYATLTRWVVALVTLVLVGTLVHKLHPAPLALPEADPLSTVPHGLHIAAWHEGDATIL